jgi:tetratricopeptide (TPR) repeat protein
MNELRSIFVVAIAVLCNECFSQSSSEYFDMYAENERNGEYARAIDNLNKAIELDSSNWNYFRKRADTYTKMGVLESAIQDINSSINCIKSTDQYNSHLKHSHQALFHQKAQLFIKLNELDSAIESYSSVYNLDIDSKPSIDAVSKRAELKRKKNDLLGAIEDYQLLTKIYREKSENWFFAIGRLNVELGKYDLAVQAFTESINSTESPSTLRYFHRAGTYTKMEKYIFALNDYNKILEVNPDDESALFFIERVTSLMKKDQ